MGKSKRKTRNQPVGKKTRPNQIGWGIDRKKYAEARKPKSK